MFVYKENIEQAVKTTEIDRSKPVLRVAVAAMLTPKSTRQYYNDLLTLISKRSGYSAKIIHRQTYSETNDMIEADEIDVAFLCSGPYVEGHKRFGMKLLAVPVVNGKTSDR